MSWQWPGSGPAYTECSVGGLPPGSVGGEEGHPIHILLGDKILSRTTKRLITDVSGCGEYGNVIFRF